MSLEGQILYWRKIMEESYIDELLLKHPRVSRFVAVKIEMQRRGVVLTPAALSRVDPSIHQTKVRSFSREQHRDVPSSLLLRDGTSVVVRCNEQYENPLIVDVDQEGELSVFDEYNRQLEKVHFWPKPLYYDYKTSKGTPMWQIINARPQRLEMNPLQYCHLWDYKGNGCKFCSIAGTAATVEKPQLLDLEEIDETLSVALREKGRYTNIMITGGMDMSGAEMLDHEVQRYIDVLQIVGKHFSTPRFPSQLIGAAYSSRQIQRLYSETGLMSYTANLEVLNPKLFAWICPGKDRFIGYEAWKERLYQAAELMGPGCVNTGIVAGVELAKPFGYSSEEEAINQTLSEAEEIMKHGVDVVSGVWRISDHSIFRGQKQASANYYLSIAEGLLELRIRYGVLSDIDTYRRCGNHPDTDLQRECFVEGR